MQKPARLQSSVCAVQMHNAQVLAMLHALGYKTLEFSGFGEQQRKSYLLLAMRTD